MRQIDEKAWEPEEKTKVMEFIDDYLKDHHIEDITFTDFLEAACESFGEIVDRNWPEIAKRVMEIVGRVTKEQEDYP